MTHWLILTATLPTSPSGLRVRIWRKLKSSHCATLREGVYILPASATTAPSFWEMDEAIRSAGAESHLLEVQARDAAQESGFRALFDRHDLYAEFAQTLKEARKAFKSASEADVRKAAEDAGRPVAALVDLQGPKFGELEIHTWKVNCDSCAKELSFEFAVDAKLGKTAEKPAATARIAGIMAAKKTSDLIPLCHPLALDKVSVKIDLDEALPGADAVMMLRLQRERMEEGLVASLEDYHRDYGLTATRLARAAKDAVVLHPGPINRGVEITDEVADGPQSLVLRQVSNGVAVRMAVLSMAMSGQNAQRQLNAEEAN